MPQQEGKPVEEVFQKTPNQVFAQSRTQYADAPAPAHRKSQGGYECPMCLRKDPPDMQVPVTARQGGGTGFQCRNGHTFDDNDDLLRWQPRMLEVKPQIAAQENYQNVTVEIPTSLVKLLQDRFGDKLGATLTSVLFCISEPKTFIINAMDAQRLATKVGEEIKSGQHLVGLITQRMEKLREAEETVETLKKEIERKRGSIPVAASPENKMGVLTVDLSDVFKEICVLAYGRGQTPEDVVVNGVKTGIEGKWI